MVRLGVLVAAAVVALLAGVSASGKEEQPLYALLGDQGRQFVAELDPSTLRALPGRRVQVGVPGAAAWSFDPTGSKLAVAIGQRLRLVDPARMRVLGSAKLAFGTALLGVLWADPDRVVVLQRLGADFRVSVVDTRRLRVVSRARLAGGTVVDAGRTSSGVALLLGPNYEIGPARLLLVGARGGVRQIGLGTIRAGAAWHEGTPPVGNQWSPALAADRNSDTVYVVSTEGSVAEVGVASATVTFRTLRGRFAKVFAGASRDAFFLDGRIVVTGEAMELTTAIDGAVGGATTPFGLETIDPSSWQVTRIAPAVSDARPWGSAIVTTGGDWSTSGGHRGAGVGVYTLDGRRLRHTLPGKRMWISTIYRDKAYGYVDGVEGLTIVDLLTGELAHGRQALPWLLLERSSLGG